jgi:hypothetical protein
MTNELVKVLPTLAPVVSTVVGSMAIDLDGQPAEIFNIDVDIVVGWSRAV